MTLFPVVERELQMAARRPVTYRLRFFPPLIFLAVWMLILAGQHRQSTAQVAREQFETLGSLAMVFCLGAGVFLTSDCLSSENREGTLGLLFLTDLRGYDVVLGKLAATSLQAVFTLFSVLPMLALPLLEGGVSVGEFWRIVLALFASLFFSLAAGMVVSACCREARQAMAGTVGILLLLGAAPAFNELASFYSRKSVFIRAAGWPSPIFLGEMAVDANYRARQADFWDSLLTISVITLTAVVIASLVLPHSWREGKRRAWSAPGKAGSPGRWRFGAAEFRRRFREEALSANPIFWLTARDRLGQLTLRILLLIGIPIWLAFYLAAYWVPKTSKEDAIVGCMVTTFVLQLILKLLVAADASRRFSEDRQSGALELLLISPLSVDTILRGQQFALIRLFRSALVIILALYFILLWHVWSPVANTLSVGSRVIFSVVFSGNMVALLADFLAAAWLGMAAGMKLRHNRAVLLAFAQVVVPGWALYLLLGGSGALSGNEYTVAFGFTLWFGAGMMFDALWIWWARSQLRTHFRAWAAGLVKSRRRIAEFRSAPPA